MLKEPNFEEQVLPHLDALYRAALGMTRNASDAEDLVQETYLRAFQAKDRFLSGTNARAWLFRILTNLYINDYRKKKRAPESSSLEETEDFYLYRRLTARPDPTPEQTVLLQIEADAVREAIAKLPDDYRETVVLADLNGLSYQEISDQLEIPLGTVRSRLSRGRNLIQKALWAYTAENKR